MIKWRYLGVLAMAGLLSTVAQGASEAGNAVTPARVVQVSSGTGSQSLVFIHGVYHGGWSFKRLYPHFSGLDDSQYLLDLRGHHGDARVQPSDAIGYQDYLADVTQLLDDIPGDKILIGHSLGGLLAMSSLQRADVSGIVLLSVPLPEVVRAKRWGLLLRYPLKSMSMIFSGNAAAFYHNRNWARKFFFDSSSTEAELDEAFRLIQTQDEPFKLFNDINRLSIDVSDNDKPVLVIHGSEDPTVDDKAAKKLAELFDVAPITIDKAGHDMMFTEAHAGAVAKVITGWLQSWQE